MAMMDRWLDADARQNPKRLSLDVTRIRRVTWLGLWGSLGLAALKFTVGILGKSQALVADAVHSLSDSTTDLAIILGVRFWSAPADESHPYGHSRIETLVTVAIGLALGGVAIGLSVNALAALRSPPTSQPGWIAFVGACASIAIKEWLFRWTLHVGRKVKSPALIANAWHHRSDALSSIPVAAAVVCAVIRRDLAFVDQVGALLVSLFVLHAAFKILRPAFGELIDSGAPNATREKIKASILAHESVEAVRAIRTRRMAGKLHVDFVIQVDGRLTVRQGHDICDQATQDLLDSDLHIEDVVVHLEPFDR